MKHFYKLAMIVVLGSGFALAQSSMPREQQPASPQQPSTSSPSSTDQQPSTAPDQSKLPNTDQSTDQNKDKDNQGAQKMPQSDAAPAAANGDVQGAIQSAIQKDPTLASSNITVDVKNGKSVELSGTVPNKDAKDSAERIAKENAGGLKIKNHIKVASASGTSQPKSDKDNMSNPKL